MNHAKMNHQKSTGLLRDRLGDKLRRARLILMTGLIGSSMAASMPAIAQEKLQNLQELDILVAAAMGAEIGEPGGARAPVDRRLKLKACPEPPQVTGPEMGAAALRCEAIGWRIRVPLLPLAANAQQNSGNGRRYHPSQQPTEQVVRRGELILLTVDKPGFSLSRVMIADKNGRVGDVIPMRAEPRGKIIFARITAPGQATIL